METTYCAYNQSRECFLALETTAGDFSLKALNQEGLLAPKPNQAFWLRTFLDPSGVTVTVPLDLIFLDAECRVQDLIESFPASGINASKRRSESVLVLPAHSIDSSETQVGDQFVLCVADEMQRRLERISSRGSLGSRTTSCVRRAGGLHSASVLELVKKEEGLDVERKSTRDELVSEPGTREFSRPKNWLQRWMSPDARKGERHPVSDFIAYFWTGGTPTAHAIRDISSTGLYLFTEERWYAGTLILMTLQDTGAPGDCGKQAIAVKMRAARMGDDGVGLEFVFADNKDAYTDQTSAEASKIMLERFLKRILSRKRK
jgi:hypothetical protein